MSAGIPAGALPGRRAGRARFPIGRVLSSVCAATAGVREPSVDRVATEKRDPFRVLIATLLSLRTKDETTEVAAARLFALADTPEALLRLPPRTIERAIFPVGFYRTKARRLLATAREVIERFGGRVPRDMDALLSLDGVGRKTANLVLTLGHDLPGICVDTHVHRITNRWGYVSTRWPDETEAELRRKLPLRHWRRINGILVTFGKTTCRPVSPWCSRCPVSRYCARWGVATSR